MKRAIYVAAALLLSLAVAPAAMGHGDEVKTTPKKGASVNAVPAEVTVSLSEDPTRDAVLRVRDGCDRNVVSDVSVSGDSIVATISDAEPGKWSATWRAISSVDGHDTDGNFSFTVDGKRDCSRDEPVDDAAAEDGSDGNASVQAGAPSNGDGAAAEDSASFPIVPVAIGAAALIAIAFVVRTAGAR
jgi:methionine-rich copper-binding protein CopC